MKRLLFLSGILFLIISSCTDEPDVINEMIVIKDCTGSYLRIRDKDFKVCNFEVLDNIDNGTVIEASFKKIESCTSYDTLITCDMYHANEGWVEITSLN